MLFFRDCFVFIDRFLGKIVVFFIILYQKVFSFDHSFFRFFYPFGFCRFCPSCSEYAILAIKKNGCFKGLFLGLIRVFRCNPFSHGGYDPVK